MSSTSSSSSISSGSVGALVSAALASAVGAMLPPQRVPSRVVGIVKVDARQVIGIHKERPSLFAFDIGSRSIVILADDVAVVSQPADIYAVVRELPFDDWQHLNE